jgi:hypothetical protein
VQATRTRGGQAHPLAQARSAQFFTRRNYAPVRTAEAILRGSLVITANDPTLHLTPFFSATLTPRASAGGIVVQREIRTADAHGIGPGFKLMEWPADESLKLDLMLAVAGGELRGHLTLVAFRDVSTTCGQFGGGCGPLAQEALLELRSEQVP